MDFIFKLTEDEAQKVINALVKQPYIDVANVINNIQKQAFEQRQVAKGSSFYAEPMEGQGKGV